MADQHLERWAQTLVEYSVKVKQGQSVAITGQIAAEPLMRAVYREVIKAGAYPVSLPSFSGINRDLFQLGSDEQLDYVTPIETFVRTQADVVINILAETNTRALASTDPLRQQRFQSRRRELVKHYLDRSAQGTLHWVITLYPTDAYAQDAGLSTDEYTAFVFEACKLNHEDPVAAWQEMSVENRRIVDWLSGRKHVHLTAPGTDLHVDITDRDWIACDGARNFPDGEVFTGPVETGVNGEVTFSYPLVAAGQEIEGITLRFEAGKVISSTAARGQAALDAILDTDDGARRLGEFAFGTNYDIQHFSKNILFDEKIGGTVHMAIGAGAPETGSRNESAVHWDMICDLRTGGRVTVDGDPLFQDGKLVL